MSVMICEKPSQAKDIAAVIGVKSSGDGVITLNQNKWGIDSITWAFGHMLELAEPDSYGSEFKSWRNLPVIPEIHKIEPKASAKKQLNVILAQIKTAKIVVIGTDPDREGDLIGWELLHHAKFKGEVKRINLLGMDKENILKALDGMSAAKQGGYFAAFERSKADWLVGMNGTRLFTTIHNKYGEVMSVGRVQTPTLQLLNLRYLNVTNFKPQNYYMVTLQTEQVGLKTNKIGEDFILDKSLPLFKALVGNTITANATLSSVKSEPPKLFELNSLSQYMNKKHGWSAKQTLDVLQALYETHKVATYPRTECAFLPEAQKQDVQAILDVIAPMIALVQKIDRKALPYRKSTFDDKKVESHHAIIPTKAAAKGLNDKEETLYTEIATRFALNFMPDYEGQKLALVYKHECDDGIADFKATITKTTVSGFKLGASDEQEESDTSEPVDSAENAKAFDALSKDIKNNLISLKIITIDQKAGKTTAPSHYTEATLLADMENVHKFVDDPELKKVFKDKEKAGIGTTATRSTIIETLKIRSFVSEEGKGKKKSLIITNKGRDLLGSLPDILKSAALTARWEMELEQIEKSQNPHEGAQKFSHNMAEFVRDLVASYLDKIPAKAEKKEPSGEATDHDCPACKKAKLKKRESVSAKTKKPYTMFGCVSFPACKFSCFANKEGNPTMEALK